MDDNKIVNLKSVRVSNELIDLTDDIFKNNYIEGEEFIFELGRAHGRMVGISKALCEQLPGVECDTEEVLNKVKEFNTRFLDIKTRLLNEAIELSTEYGEYIHELLNKQDK